ncbi:MAG: hypothetical protein ACI9XU_000204, partial [Arenicella sp.]
SPIKIGSIKPSFEANRQHCKTRAEPAFTTAVIVRGSDDALSNRNAGHSIGRVLNMESK